MPYKPWVWIPECVVGMKRRDCLWILCLGVTQPTVAWAYILPTRRLVGRIQRAIRKTKLNEVKGMSRSWASGRGAPQPVFEHWNLGVITRLRIRTKQGQTASWSSDGHTAGDMRLLPPSGVGESMTRILGQADILGWMATHRVDGQAQRLALLDDRVCIVIGAQTASVKKPQIWVDQSTFLPLRLIFKSVEGWVDMALMHWRGPITHSRCPHDVRVRLNGRRNRQLSVSEVNPFDLESAP